MYLEKRRRPAPKNRRVYPRLRCNLAVEFSAGGSSTPKIGNLSNISLGGCYVQTDAPCARGEMVTVSIKTGAGPLRADGEIVWADNGYGFAVQFKLVGSDQQERLLRIMEFIENRMLQREKPHLSKLSQ